MPLSVISTSERQAAVQHRCRNSNSPRDRSARSTTFSRYAGEYLDNVLPPGTPLSQLRARTRPDRKPVFGKLAGSKHPTLAAGTIGLFRRSGPTGNEISTHWRLTNSEPPRRHPFQQSNRHKLLQLPVGGFGAHRQEQRNHPRCPFVVPVAPSLGSSLCVRLANVVV